MEGAGGFWKRVQLTRKTPSSGFPQGFGCTGTAPRRWKALSCRATGEDSSVKKRRHLEQDKVGIG